MKIKTAIILAGGKGTRLRSVIGEYPKPMADVNGHPFLEILLSQIQKTETENVILAVGYQSTVIETYFGNQFGTLRITYSKEETPLGTGGALKKAMECVPESEQDVMVFNGDTFFDISFPELISAHQRTKAQCTIAAPFMKKADRYGTIETNDEGRILSFSEKKSNVSGNINGGIYVIQKGSLKGFPSDTPFSFEEEYLSKKVENGGIYAASFPESYFMDIGIPEDYDQFKKDQQKMIPTPLNQLPIDKTWTLFLDRDGVINERLIDDYVKFLHELEIIKGVPEAVHVFSKRFGRIVVVTNQQGIGKGMMTAEDLSVVHGYIGEVIENAGGKIDHFFFAPQLNSENHPDRKPGTGMGIRAQEMFPEIDFNKSLMIGDSESDIEFGMKLGMKTIMLKNGRNLSTKADYIFEHLYSVAQKIK